ncbi:MAG: DNRLRE domain-containing protein [Planctomyces sp.]
MFLMHLFHTTFRRHPRHPSRRGTTRPALQVVSTETLENRALLSTFTATLDASQDSTIYNVPTGDLSNGSGQFLIAGGATGFATARRGLVSFDVAAAGIPPGSTILDAVVTLYVVNPGSAASSSIGLHPISKPWGESASNAPDDELEGARAAARDATWQFSLFDSVGWASPGGDFGGASASLAVGGVGAWEWAGSGIVGDVQKWLDNPLANNGWMIVSDEQTGSIKSFASRESDNATLRPRLEITWEEPFVPAIVEGRKWFDRNADSVRQAPAVQALSLFWPNGRNSFNAFGGREYWFRSSVANAWFFLTPQGDLVRWNAQPGKLTGTTVDSPGVRAWHNPTSLLGTTATPGTPADEPWLNGFSFQLVNDQGQIVATTQSRDIDLNNDGLVQEEQERGWYRFENVRPGNYTVQEIVPAGWAQSPGRHSPSAGTAWQLDQSLGLSATGDLFENFGGLGERWLKSTTGWCYITPVGDLFQWNGKTITATAPLSGTLAGTLNNFYYLDVSLLAAAQNPVIPVTGGTTVSRIDFGNYRPAVIEGRTWLEIDPNGSRGTTLLPQAVVIAVPEAAPPALRTAVWYEVPVLETSGPAAGTTVRRTFFINAGNEVWQWSATTGSTLLSRVSKAAKTPGDVAAIAFAFENWQNDITVELLNDAGFVVARTNSASLDRNTDGIIQPEAENGWYRFSTLLPGNYSVRQVVPASSRTTSEVGTNAQTGLRTLAENYGFTADASDHYNFGGLNERWFRSRRAEWFYILPNGQIFQWDRLSGGTKGPVKGTPIAKVPGSVYLNLSLLFRPVSTRLTMASAQSSLLNLSQTRLLDTVFAGIAQQIAD